MALLIGVLYQPIPIPDNDSMVDKYRPSIQLQPLPEYPDLAIKNDLKADDMELPNDSIAIIEYYVFRDSTIIIP